MTLEHVAIWTDQLETLKDFYVQYFDGIANNVYINEQKQFRSYFVRFASGARLEIMSRPDIPANLNDTIVKQYRGIIHLAFEVDGMQAVEDKAVQLKNAGLTILSGPRKTGDGYYEFETLDPDNNRLEVTTKFVG
jgi:lactoylglutathione lyase